MEYINFEFNFEDTTYTDEVNNGEHTYWAANKDGKIEISEETYYDALDEQTFREDSEDEFTGFYCNK